MEPRLAWSALIGTLVRLCRPWGTLDADRYDHGLAERVAELRLRQYY